MKQKRIIWLSAAAILAGLLLGIWCYERYAGPEDGLPPLLRVDGTLYQLDKEVENYIGRQPDGNLKVIGENAVPSENEQANFGQDGMPYWHHQRWILVMINDTCLLFEEANIQE